MSCRGASRTPPNPIGYQHEASKVRNPHRNLDSTIQSSLLFVSFDQTFSYILICGFILFRRWAVSRNNTNLHHSEHPVHGIFRHRSETDLTLHVGSKVGAWRPSPLALHFPCPEDGVGLTACSQLSQQFWSLDKPGEHLGIVDIFEQSLTRPADSDVAVILQVQKPATSVHPPLNRFRDTQAIFDFSYESGFRVRPSVTPAQLQYFELPGPGRASCFRTDQDSSCSPGSPAYLEIIGPAEAACLTPLAPQSPLQPVLRANRRLAAAC